MRRLILSLIIFTFLTPLYAETPKKSPPEADSKKETVAKSSKPDKEEKPKKLSKPVPNTIRSIGVSIGYGNNFISSFEIGNPDADDDEKDGEENETRAMFDGSSSSPYLTITTGNLAPNALHWQIMIEAGYTEFELDKQTRDGIEYDYGTSVEGSYTYLMPMLIYNTSAINTHPNKEVGLRLGGGLGIGRLEAKGTARYTDKTTRTSTDPNKIHIIDVNSSGLAAKLFAEYRFYGLFLNSTIKMITASGVDAEGNNNTYTVFDMGVNAGYSLHF